MGFAKENLSRWNREQINSTSAASDRFGFETYKKGVNNENHPFKIFLIGTTAPVITSDSPTLSPTLKKEFEMTVAINQGFIYDLSLYDNTYTHPLFVSRRKDGRFLFLSYSKREILSLRDMEYMKIPVKIGSAPMVEVTPGIVNGPTVDLKIKTIGENVDYLDVDLNGTGCLFMEVIFRNVQVSVAGKATPISSAAILTAEEIRNKYGSGTDFSGGVVTIPSEFLRNRTRFIRIYNPELSMYVAANKPTFKTIVDGSTNSPELNEVQPGPFQFTFYPIPHTDGQVLKNHLFLRIS